ncbi:hypothetical protein BC940DRAFT_300887 [Gongronella butleri]|nr:hypothetical protein BC940DRAFT_300887 [Gongronella butleri]
MPPPPVKAHAVHHCSFCTKTTIFTRKGSHLRHLENKHDMKLVSAKRGVELEAPPGYVVVESCETADTVLFCCPSCPRMDICLESIGKHLVQHLESVAPDSPLQTEMHASKSSIRSRSPSPSSPSVKRHCRSHDDAVLHACQLADASDIDKKKTLFIVDALSLKPLSVMANGVESNALAHPHVIQQAVADAASVRAVGLTKRTFYAADSSKNACGHCCVEHPVALQQLITSSPYRRLLETRHFVELTPDLGLLLNRDWLIHPQLKHAAAQLLAGAILLNSSNGQAVMVNCVEVYGRTKAIDAHREHFGSIKGHTMDTSLPPPIPIKYKDVWPTTLSTGDGPKLIIGSQTCNALVTSSMRLDRRELPSVGATTFSFSLSERSDALATQIFFDMESVQRALEIANDTTATAIDVIHLVGQLRQLNSKYDDLTTYFLCRASGPITKAHQCQPYSLFTLHEFDKGRSAAAALFNGVAASVIANGRDALLRRDDIQDALDASTGNVSKIINEIMALFKDEQDTIPIIKNTALSKILEKLPPLLHPIIATANKSVQSAINATFNVA